MKTRKLSRLQREILKAALLAHWNGAYDGGEGFLSSATIGKFFFKTPHLSESRGGNLKYQNEKEYRQRRKIHNRVDASISRCLRRLQERGLIERVKMPSQRPLTIREEVGCRLTKQGLEAAQSLFPNLSGPNKEEERKMKDRGDQERIAKQKHEQAKIEGFPLVRRQGRISK